MGGVKEVLFEVRMDGHLWRIYTNGEIEGFGDPGETVITYNRFPVIMARELALDAA